MERGDDGVLAVRDAARVVGFAPLEAGAYSDRAHCSSPPQYNSLSYVNLRLGSRLRSSSIFSSFAVCSHHQREPKRAFHRPPFLLVPAARRAPPYPRAAPETMDGAHDRFPAIP